MANVSEKINIGKKLKRIGTVMAYPRPTDKSEYKISVLAFSDASKSILL